MTEHFLSVAQSIDDLHSEDKELRLSAMRALTLIAQTLGPERTREELIPYITDYLDDDDSVLRTMAGKLGSMLPEVGGLVYLNTLLVPLENLAMLDEITVRDDAIAAINMLSVAAFSPQTGSVEAQSTVLNAITRLAAAEYPPGRCSACGLVAIPLSMGPAATRRDAIALFNKLCNDPEVSVRRTACVALGQSVAAATGATCSDMLPQLAKFAKDSSDSVRLHTVSAAVAMSTLLSDTGVAQIVTLIRNLSTDAVSRVRFMVADRLAALVGAWHQKDAKIALGLFKTLCSDTVPEVRAAMVFSLDRLVAHLPTDEMKKEALDIALKLLDDEVPHVRNCLASVLLKAVSNLPRGVIATSVVPACTKLVKDSDPQVRLGVVASFTAAGTAALKSEALGTIATAMIPVISSLASDTNWRVRENVIEQLPAIVQSGTEMTPELVNVCLGGLTDRVATIRAAASSACRQLATRNGASWTATTLLPKALTALGSSTNYMHRITLLHLIRMLLESMDAAFCRTELLPIISRFASDNVPNVRMNAALALKQGVQQRKLSASDVDSITAKLKSDADGDVRDVFA